MNLLQLCEVEAGFRKEVMPDMIHSSSRSAVLSLSMSRGTH